MVFYFRCTQCNGVFSGTPEQGTLRCDAPICVRGGWVTFVIGEYYIWHHAEFIRKM